MSKRKHDQAAEPAAVPEDRTNDVEPRAKKAKREKKVKKDKTSKRTADDNDDSKPRSKSTSKQRRLIARATARGDAPPPSVTLEFGADGQAIHKASNEDAVAEATPKKSKSKKTKDKKPDADADADADTAGVEPAVDEDEQDAAKAVEAKKKNRFIVFIGNLPYTTTDEALATHFASVKPAAIRHITKPGSSNTNGFPESKGYAFVEFEDYDRLKTCLKSFHRSEFTCGGKMRQMNVELTAGGGGKGEARKEKTRAKNEKLGEERKRRMIEEAKKKAEKLEVNAEGEVVEKGAKKDRKDRKDKRKKQSSKEEDAAAAPAAAANGWGHEDRGGMHPARMAMMSR